MEVFNNNHCSISYQETLNAIYSVFRPEALQKEKEEFLIALSRLVIEYKTQFIVFDFQTFPILTPEFADQMIGQLSDILMSGSILQIIIIPPSSELERSFLSQVLRKYGTQSGFPAVMSCDKWEFEDCFMQILQRHYSAIAA